MIICPNCNSENADQANHCGNCGSRLTKGSGQKTMFGFAAVTPEAMKEAAEQAKAAAASAQDNDSATDAPAGGSALPKPGLPKLGGAGAAGGGLPKPSLPPLGGGSSLPSPSGSSLPTPGAQAQGESDVLKTEMLDSVPGPGDAPVDAGIQQNFGAPASTDEPNPFASTAPPGESHLRPPTDSDAPAAEASGGFGAPAPSSEPSGGFGSPSASPEPSGGFGSPMGQPQDSGGFGGGTPLSPETQPELSTPASAAPMTASPMGSSPGLPQTAPNNPMQPGGGFGGGGGGGFGGGNYERGEVQDPIKLFVLIMVTCGFYGLIWFHKYMGDLNKGLGEERFVFMKELGLTIITCGLWGYWLWWRVANSTVEVQEKWGVQPVMDPIILIVTMIIGVGPFFLQQSLNNAWENGNPPA